MDVDRLMEELRNDPNYADQIVHVHTTAPRTASHSSLEWGRDLVEVLPKLGIDQLYSHQTEAIQAHREGQDVLIATGTSSGKSLCYMLPIIEAVQTDPNARALLLFPTKALCQDQFRNFNRLKEAAGVDDLMAGVYDGDSPGDLRKKIRDEGTAVFSNPDMVHSALMPQHGRWADFLANLKIIVLDELHVYNGIFGSNMALLLTRLLRLCRHYGSSPQFIASSATIANPVELARRLTGRDFALVDRDGSPRGRKTYVLWNPPRIRATDWRSRRSANVEAHELMARLVRHGMPTITFSKAKMTAEMIHRYVQEKLRTDAPGLVSKVTPYRGGYLPSERREIERRLFSGELLGVSTTPALELGIDVGSLEACIIVGYPGTLASFFQQAGRAGRKEKDSIIFLVGLDTSINQYIMTNPQYIFDRCIEEAVIDPQNPFVTVNHLRCAAHEQPVNPTEMIEFGPHAPMAVRVLEDHQKLTDVEGNWYYSANETPQHEVALRASDEANVLIENVDTGEVIGEVIREDAEPLLHPEAIYMHLGETFRVLELDLDKDLARVTKVEVDYYTQPHGGTDVHHIDHRLREKGFGCGKLYWGEVTAHCNTYAFEKVRFYELDAVSVHGVDLPVMNLETMAFWIEPPELLLETVRRAGLDAHAGMRGIGYATRMILPLFITCDTRDFSHSIGCANAPWNSIFIFEKFPHGLGFTEKAYNRMHEILPHTLEVVEQCPCDQGCPCCVGKPLRTTSIGNVERGEGQIPSKAAALMILRGLLGDCDNLENEDREQLTESQQQWDERLERALRRRLDRGREPKVFHPITPQGQVATDYPEIEKTENLQTSDVESRARKRYSFDRDFHKRLAKKMDLGGLDPLAKKNRAPKGMRTGKGELKPTAFPGRPQQGNEYPIPNKESTISKLGESAAATIKMGDSLAARARRLSKKRKKDNE